ncbi:class I SAM-dependent methyltransferase [Mycobacterium sp.]|uniref:class I SAM-dependent methyltransferase n=1 Tax=Mycobacterium sp. TaxID=1785 RepID=UPI002D1BF505|nr:methyltransferase domain-containing protein [Mycobacterium sp.]HTY33953.1 methyltransferase domain-containing protein [Mycobacterium sp.]
MTSSRLRANSETKAMLDVRVAGCRVEPIDRWASWLRHRANFGDQEDRVALQRQLVKRRDRVLDRARVGPGDVVLDLGSGDGLVAFGALIREPTCKVVLCDISEDVLAEARARAQQLGVVQRCSFVHTSAERLVGITDRTVDVVTICALLIHIADKRACFTECARVMRVGGRLSVFEPVNRVGYPDPPETFWGYDIEPVAPIAAKLRAFYDQYIPPRTDPMLDFDEHDLVEYAVAAGFSEIKLDYRLHISRRLQPRTWEVFLGTEWNPRSPSLGDAMREVLTEQETAAFEAHLRPLIEVGRGSRRSAVAYLSAIR